MRARTQKNIDWLTFSLYLGLVGIGWMMIFTVGYGEGYPSDFGSFISTPVGKQTIWIGISLFFFLITLIIDWKFWRTFATPIYIIAMVLLAGVLIFGTTVKGAKSWFVFAGFSLQPSEFAKFATCIGLAAYLSSYGVTLRNIKMQLSSIAIFAVPIGLILLQPDAGSAIVFLSFFVVLYREGFSATFFIVSFSAATLLILGLVNDPVHIAVWLVMLGNVFLILNLKKRVYLLLGYILIMSAAYFTFDGWYGEQILFGNIALLIAFSSAHWLQKKRRMPAMLLTIILLGTGLAVAANFAFDFLEEHQQERIKVWLKPEECDPHKAAYNLVQSKMAIGSGGLQGKGFLQGNLTQGNFVPEQITDFIFSTVGEEQGFIGGFAIIAMFWLLIIRIIMIAERQRSDFVRHYAYGLAGILFIHVFINIGMTMGVTPIIGIPLPFISKGGSSLLAFTIMMGVLLKMDSHRLAS